MAAFYNQGDQEIYKNFQYVPQEKYRLGFTAPTTTPTAAPVSGGITNTNAFTNSGGNNFNPAGNAFGYGSPVSEVNVRTFNPQSNDPTGKIANAQTMYNKASSDLADPFNRLALTETFTGMRPSKEVMDYYGEQIMDNKEQYGAQGQYVSPYDDTVDQSKYTTTIGSFPSRGFFNRLRNKGVNLSENIPYIGPAVRVLKGFLPEKEDRGPGGGTYGIGGLSDAQKTYYNALAKEGYLFSGNQGFKTLTGKNFNLSDKQFDKYVSGQIEMYEKLKDEEELTGFQKKQLLEATAVYKATQVQKQKQKEEFNKPGGTGEQVATLNQRMKDEGVTGANYNQAANERGGGGGNTATYGGQTAREATYDNDSSTGTSQGYSQHYADGGRAGYFFGGRVNFKDGGLASIL